MKISSKRPPMKQIIIKLVKDKEKDNKLKQYEKINLLYTRVPQSGYYQ